MSPLEERATAIEEAKIPGPFHLLVGDMVLNTSVSFRALITPILHAIDNSPDKRVWVKTAGGAIVFEA